MLLLVLQVGAASDHDLVLLQGQLEEARAEAVSASRQWAAERQQLVASAQSMWAELQRCHEALAQTVGQVGVCCQQRRSCVAPCVLPMKHMRTLQGHFFQDIMHAVGQPACI